MFFRFLTSEALRSGHDQPKRFITAGRQIRQTFLGCSSHRKRFPPRAGVCPKRFVGNLIPDRKRLASRSLFGTKRFPPIKPNGPAEPKRFGLGGAAMAKRLVRRKISGKGKRFGLQGPDASLGHWLEDYSAPARPPSKAAQRNEALPAGSLISSGALRRLVARGAAQRLNTVKNCPFVGKSLMTARGNHRMFTKDPPAAVVAHAQHQGEDHFPFAGAQIHAAGGGNKAGAAPCTSARLN